jgi:hypothetical protein
VKKIGVALGILSAAKLAVASEETTGGRPGQRWRATAKSMMVSSLLTSYLALIPEHYSSEDLAKHEAREDAVADADRYVHQHQLELVRNASK